MLEQPGAPIALQSQDHLSSQEALSRFLLMIERSITVDGVVQTVISFLSLVRHSAQTPQIPSVLTPSFCLVLQGAKEVRCGRDVLQYGAGDYLISVVDLPVFAQVIGATWQSSYLGLRIDLTTKDIASVLKQNSRFFVF